MPPGAGGLEQREVDRRPERRVGEFGQGACSLHYRPDAADIGERDQERRLALHLAQKPRRLGLVAGRGDGACSVAQETGEAAIGIARQKTHEPARLAARQFPEER